MMSMSMEQRLSMGLSQRQELKLQFGPLEEQLWEKAKFFDIDIEKPSNAYHRDILQSILLRNDESRTSLVGQILREREDLTEEDIDAGVGLGGCDAGRNVAIGEQLDACTDRKSTRLNSSH